MSKELSDMTLEELWKLFPIILKEHNTDYLNWYNDEKQQLLEIIDKGDIKRINHIGSSSVKGLISKPIVDILLEINNEINIDQLISKLINNGWTIMSSEKSPILNMSFNKGYTIKGFAEKVFHLHVRYYDNWNELYFRDYLREHEEVADEYGRLKLSLLDKYKNNRDGYTNAKTDFILKYTEKAKEEFGDKYKP
ncbi:GrpB family protein [Vallitalea maricola]|uniref:GrpB family protein n=1 Tax=Vallitalea maricola TaxID=3074433 RepID=A0ACB5ULR3_9FIRM|nr:GrpB family protein [Vallitalea sp. AN17-2]